MDPNRVVECKVIYRTETVVGFCDTADFWVFVYLSQSPSIVLVCLILHRCKDSLSYFSYAHCNRKQSILLYGQAARAISIG